MHQQPQMSLRRIRFAICATTHKAQEYAGLRKYEF